MVDAILVLLGSLTAFCGAYNAFQIREFILKLRNLQITGGRISNLKNSDEDVQIKKILDVLRSKAGTGIDLVSTEVVVSGKMTRGSTIAIGKMGNQDIDKIISSKYDRREPVFIKNYFMSGGWFSILQKEEIETENFHVYDSQTQNRDTIKVYPSLKM